MKILLRADVDGLGRRGDIVEVAGGFARNHLLPAAKALQATPKMEAQAAAMRRARDLRAARDRRGAEAQAQVLVGSVLTISARAGKAGRLFGSVGPAEVAAAILEQKGVDVDRRSIALEDHIKTVGSHDVTLNLPQGVVVAVTVEVVPA